MIEIIASQSGHGDRVIEIWRSAVDATHDFLSPEDRQSLDHEVSEFLPQAPLWLARVEGDLIAGFMMVTGRHMDALFIDPDLHGRGVGRSLVEHAITLHGDLTTDVNAQNPGAIAFYKALGFVETGRSDLDDQGRAYPIIHLARGGAPTD
jgi:putative acetyltransferase